MKYKGYEYRRKGSIPGINLSYMKGDPVVKDGTIYIVEDTYKGIVTKKGNRTIYLRESQIIPCDYAPCGNCGETKAMIPGHYLCIDCHA